MTCIILGDSIAVGTHMFYTECQLYGRSGITSTEWNRVYPSVSQNANVAVISLGTNDYGFDNKEELKKARAKVKAERVYWILPYGINKADTVREIAGLNGDTVVAIESISPDKIHPTAEGYKKIVSRVK